jgi:hypothetical protein
MPSRLLHSGPIEPRRLSGRCASGTEGGKGRVYHAVPIGASQLRGVAVCGAKPGRLSGVGWMEYEAGDAVTCKRCQARLGP